LSRLLEIHVPDAEAILEEVELPLLVGSGPDAHIRLPGDLGILAMVDESRGHLFLQPVGSAPALDHNDQPLRRSVWLKSGDVSRVGGQEIHWRVSGRRLQVRLSRVEPPEPGPPSATLSPSPEVLPPGALPPPPSQGTPPTPRRLRLALAGLFALLLLGALFVLLAVPLEVTVEPVPETLEISGFPPLVPFGSGYLGIPGRYRLRAEKTGFRPLEADIELTAERGSYRFTLEKLPGLVEFAGLPSGTRILVDGVEAGRTPPEWLEIAPGRHRLRFEHPRYRPLEQGLQVTGGGARQRLQVALQPAWARVRIVSAPSGALLSIDGEPQGRTPLQLELLEGRRKLRFELEKFTPLETELDIVAGRELRPPVFRLQPAPARFALSSVPAGAVVALDGRFAGRTPLQLELSAGQKHVLQLTATGYRSRTLSVRLAAAQQDSREVRLEPEYGVVFISATPADAELAIDGRTQPRAVGRFRLTTRPHKLELRAPGYRNLVRTVIPRAGYSQRFELTLAREGERAAAASSRLPERIETALGQPLVLIRPTPFRMGASRREAGRRANEREHQVVLERPFYMAVHEVTNREYRQFRAAHNSGSFAGRSLDIADHPVVGVGWEDAARFLNWLSARDGLPPYYREEQGKMTIADPRGIGYRLPTEAEWAYAARRAGRAQPARYPWAGRYPPPVRAGNFADRSAEALLPVVLTRYDDGFPLTAPVGRFPANPVGIFDLGGNVAEWCQDYYSARPEAARPDPLGPPRGSHRVVRGSSWRDAGITELRFSYRRYSREPADDIGFRFVRYAR